MDTHQLIDLIKQWFNTNGSELLITIISAIVGAIISAVLDFRSKATSFIFKYTDKSRVSTKTEIHDSPGASHVEGGANSPILNAVDSPGAVFIAQQNNYSDQTPTIGSRNEALGLPVTNTDNVGNISEERKHICTRVNEVLKIDLISIYVEASRYLESRYYKLSASEFYRIYNQVSIGLKGHQKYSDTSIRPTITLLEESLLNLKSYVDEMKDNDEMIAFSQNCENLLIRILANI